MSSPRENSHRDIVARQGRMSIVRAAATRGSERWFSVKSLESKDPFTLVASLFAREAASHRRLGSLLRGTVDLGDDLGELLQRIHGQG